MNSAHPVKIAFFVSFIFSAFALPGASQQPVENTVRTVKIATPTPGIVVQIDVALNDKVESGDPIMRLDDRKELMIHRVAVLKLAYVKSELQIVQSKHDQQAYRARVVSSLGSQPEKAKEQSILKGLFAEVQKARAEIAIQEAEIEMAMLAVELRTIRATGAGTIQVINAQVGEYVVPTTPVVIFQPEANNER